MALPSIVFNHECPHETHTSSSARLGLNLAFLNYTNIQAIYFCASCQLKYQILVQNMRINLHKHPDKKTKILQIEVKLTNKWF